MKAWNYLSVVIVGALGSGVLFGSACGSNDDTSTATGAGGSSSDASSSSKTVSHSSSSTTSVSAGGTGGGEPGTGICMSDASIDGDVYDGCLTANCCDSFNPCNADADCGACLADPTAAGCDTNALYATFKTCFDGKCPTAVCGTMLATPSPNLNACIQTNCCTTFNACEADMACNACLMDPMGAGCDALVIFTDYTTCRDMACPADICGTHIIFGVTYDNMSQDTAFDSNKCAAMNCCTDLTACADPSGDMYLDMNDPEVTACVDCLQENATCMDGPVKTSATAFNTCFKAKCPQ